MSSVTLSVRASPNSKHPGRITPYGERVRITLASTPTDNKANEELVWIIAREHGVKPTAVEIVSGLHGRDKAVRVTLG